MTTTRKTTTTPSPVEVARQAVEQASTRHAAATEAADLATQASSRLVERLRSGDDDVLADDLMRSDAEVVRTAALLSFATDALAEAKAARAITVATATAADLADAEGFDLDTLTAEARATITNALEVLRSRIDARNARLSEAMTTAAGAGLIAGECDPLSPVVVKPKTFRSPATLVIDGAAVTAVDAPAVLAAVLVEVAA